jgi:DNA-binding transcriptional ArsR family regulator
MPEPRDQMPAAVGRGHLRACHADREQVIGVLKAAFVQGRLGKHELNARVGQALAARTYADLATLTADLPAGLAAAEPPYQPARVRLGILTIAHEARRVEFSYLRDTLGLTAGNLSQHLGVLETAGLIAIEKGYAGKRARTWVTLTKAGQAALEDEIAQLKLLISRIEPAETSPS